MSSVCDPPAPTGARPLPAYRVAERVRAAVAGAVPTPGADAYRHPAADAVPAVLVSTRSGALYAGGLTYRVEDSGTVLRAWRGWLATAPDCVTSSVAVLNLPAVPVLPASLHGATVLHLRYAHSGDPARGAELLAPLRQVATPVLDTTCIHHDPDHPMPVPAIDALLAAAAGQPITFAEIRALGGAIARQSLSPGMIAGRHALGHARGLIGYPAPEADG
ncbi:hypothetical protein [Nocardia sp. CA-145437]|uniref:hypothetical protein n=1 Tax=Nocardia sp. CA-145437 TaxID=3239980 RepID=UPI003D96996C